MYQLNDAQQATFGFVYNQSLLVNSTVYETKFPDLDFGRLVYVDSSAPEFAPGIATFISSTLGKADWFSGAAKDIKKADVTRDRVETRFHMAAIGYGYNIEEAGQAQLMGMNLDTGKAEAARRAYMEFMWNVTLTGDTTKGLAGLISQTAGVTIGTAPADGTGSVTTWFATDGTMTKTATQILRDFNNVILGIFTGSLTVEMADTVLLPYSTEAFLGATPMSATNSETVLSFIERNNVYTRRTGQPLTIRGELGLDAAGAGATKRMVAYANRQDVVKLHLPMPHRFLPVATADNVHFDIPGIFRTGGVEVIRPGAFRYLDGI
ncbi:DUF2184 domain-containing protein [Sphingomonas paeninsulae]|uniref:DUF2184 domain-containing protein n=1 Tax=Sphingomonas paeninsulae TaxID=2319844 RepID=A0A494TDP6_SPHPE|nr:DUF2184 domain-containing protein [Sphingomonas paeninsulae]AYJ87659.1 DUF2184 domain-containing protein [Sphingomonas paeninsulae]